MNKTDGEGVPQSPSPGNSEHVCPCGQMHSYEQGTSLLDRLLVCFSHGLVFIFESMLFL